MEVTLDYRLPAEFLAARPPVEDEPLWIGEWERKQIQIAGVVVMLTALAAILFFQEGVRASPRPVALGSDRLSERDAGLARLDRRRPALGRAGNRLPAQPALRLPGGRPS